MIKKKKAQRLSVGYIDSLCSKAVRAIWNHTCAVCGELATDSHHIVKRSKCWALRWDAKNGIALCRECHHKAESIELRSRICELVDIEYLCEMEKKFRFKADFLLDRNESDGDYMRGQAARLKAIAIENIKID